MDDRSETSSKGEPNRRTLIRNIVTNYAYVGIMGVLTILLTPIYMRILGREQWGIVALCMTIQGALFILDAGLAQTMPRDVARAETPAAAHQTYRSYLGLYSKVALAAFVVGQLLLPFVVTLLPDAGASPDSTVLIALRLALVQFLFQLPNNAAIGYWNGLEMQVQANVRRSFFVIGRHCAALLLLVWHPSATAYMVPFAVIAAFECIANIRKVRSEGHGRSSTTVTALDSKTAWSIGGFSAAVVVGMLSAQIDRIYLAATIPAGTLGTYVVVASFALTLMHLQSPVIRAFLPRIIAAKAPGREIRKLLGVVAIVAVTPCLVVAIWAQEILTLWLSNERVAAEGADTFSLVACAVAMNSVFAVAYTLIVRQNLYPRLILLNLAILAAKSVVLVSFVERCSIVAGGLAWITGSTLQLAFASWVIWELVVRSRSRQP